MVARKNETREYFRVKCDVLLSCNDCGTTKTPRTPPDQYFPDSESLNLLKELGRIDHDHSQLLHAIAESDRNTSAYLGAINRKVDIIARHLVSHTRSQTSRTEQEVSLSEGGLSFHAGEALAPGSIVAMHLTLLPSYVGFATYAEILTSTPEGDGYELSAEFRSLSSSDRQILARHVIQVQLIAQRNKVMKE